MARDGRRGRDEALSERKAILVTVDTDLTDAQIEAHAATLYLCEDTGLVDNFHRALDIKVCKIETKKQTRGKEIKPNAIVIVEGPGASWRGKFKAKHLDGGDLGNGEGRCVAWVVTLADAQMFSDGKVWRNTPVRKLVNVLAWSIATE